MAQHAVEVFIYTQKNNLAKSNNQNLTLRNGNI